MSAYIIPKSFLSKVNLYNTIGFLIDQSKEYIIATLSSFLEFFLENYFFHEIKYNTSVMLFGIIIVFIGHYFRIGAEFTAKQNFSHKISTFKEREHKLVTQGLYK
jgi:protein-S-isoprenylcysteine O-methyltransferase